MRSNLVDPQMSPQTKWPERGDEAGNGFYFLIKKNSTISEAAKMSIARINGFAWYVQFQGI
jgi:hypothetical protein